MEQEAVTINVVLQELREFRAENNERWEANDKRWEENDKKWEDNMRRWEENDKKWEDNMKRWEENDKKWEYNMKRWEENDKKWEENMRRWEENDKKWEDNMKRWEANDKRLNENDKKWEENSKNLEGINLRLTRLEKAREIDKKEFTRIWTTMENTILNELKNMEKRMDIRFEKIEAILQEHESNQKEFKKKISSNESKINLHDVRIEKLEDWKDEFESGEFIPA